MTNDGRSPIPRFVRRNSAMWAIALAIVGVIAFSIWRDSQVAERHAETARAADRLRIEICELEAASIRSLADGRAGNKEAAAATRLKIANRYLDRDAQELLPEARDEAIKRLEMITQEYPETEAGRSARLKLSEMRSVTSPTGHE